MAGPPAFGGPVGPVGLLDLCLAESFVLAGHVLHLDALVGERTHGRVEGFRWQVGAVERHHDISHGQGTTLPS